jgi:hypothetical protein
VGYLAEKLRQEAASVDALIFFVVSDYRVETTAVVLADR